MEDEPEAAPSSGRDPLSVVDFYDDGGYVNRALYVSEILEMWNLMDLVRHLNTDEKCAAYSIEHGLVRAERECRVHRKKMNIIYSRCKALGTFMCYRGNCKYSNTRCVPRKRGTLFENARIPLPYIFYLMYAFARRWSYSETIFEDPYRWERKVCLSSATISDWYRCFREVVVIYHLENQKTFTNKIGGPGKVVQIDEAKFGKRKYNKGK